jgi:hypothetical protein
VAASAVGACGMTAMHSTFAGALLERINCHQIPFEDPPQPVAEVSGYGLTAARSGRDLREFLEDPSRFKVFAFVSSMLNPHAGRDFRRLRLHQEFRTKHNQRTGRELKHGYIGKKKYTTDAQLEKRAEHLTQVAEDLWWFPNATVNSISKSRNFGRPPQWIQRYWKGEGDIPLDKMYPVNSLGEPVGTDVCISRTPPAEYFIDLVKDQGYDPDAAWSSITHPIRPQTSDRGRNGGHPTGDKQSQGWRPERDLNQGPYIAAPSRRTTQGDGFARREVAKVVDSMRIDLPTRRAVTKIVYARLPLKVVAKAYSIKWQTLKTYAQRVRLRLRTNRQ